MARFLSQQDRLSLLFLLLFVGFCQPLLVVWANPAADTPISDPLPEAIPTGSLQVKLIDFIQAPATSNNAPKARISFLTHANDNSGRLFFNDLRGYLYVVQNGAMSTYLALKENFPQFVDAPGLGTGFMFFAFHPEFASNGKFYTIHSEKNATESADYLPVKRTADEFDSVLNEWTTTNPAANTFDAAGSVRELLRVRFSSRFHNFQQIAFNPNTRPGAADYGLLYLSLGDGEVQTAATWTDGAQNLAYPHGKILRIDPAGNNSPNGRYGIPADNPFVGQSGKLGEIWAYGLRNPHRFSWDQGGSGKLILTNIGEQNIESIYLGSKGANYGWNEREGEFLFQTNDQNNVYPLPTNDASLGYTYPVAMYDHDEGEAVVGGFVYRGAAIRELQGKYLFGDIVKGRIFYIEESAITPQAAAVGNNAQVYELKLVDSSNKPVTLLNLVAPSTRVDLRFGLAADGEIFVSSKQNGQIWQLVAASATVTPTPSSTPTPSPTPSTTLPAELTVTSTATVTPSPTLLSETPSPTSSATPTPSPTASGTAEARPTVSATTTPPTGQPSGGGVYLPIVGP